MGLLGYHASGGVDASTDIGVLSLRLVYCVGPIALYALSVPLIWSYPLTPFRHARLHASLTKRNQRRARATAAENAIS